MPMASGGRVDMGSDAELGSGGALPGLRNLGHFRAMRESEPVWHEPGTGDWHVYRYADAAAVLADHETYSSDFATVDPGMSRTRAGNIVAMDPPQHHHVRRLVSQAFTPQSIALLEGWVEQITERLLDGVRGEDRFELISTVGSPLPVTVIAELLGVPSEDREQFHAWVDAGINQVPAGGTGGNPLQPFLDYLPGHVARHRADPAPDLIGRLIAAEVDGRHLSDAEICGFATLLLVAGNITTTDLIGNAAVCLDEHPEAQEALRRKPALIPTAVEEMLRYRSPIAQDERYTTREARIGDTLVPARQTVKIWLLSANHDEREFESPDQFRFDREPNRHLAFGRGVHFCLGAPLARLEARVALRTLLRRYASLRLDRSGRRWSTPTRSSPACAPSTSSSSPREGDQRVARPSERASARSIEWVPGSPSKRPSAPRGRQSGTPAWPDASPPPTGTTCPDSAESRARWTMSWFSKLCPIVPTTGSPWMTAS
jgi:cytochrome P450